MEDPSSLMEVAAIKAVSNAANSVIKALGTRLSALSDRLSAADKARAIQIRKDIEHSGQMKRRRESNNEKRINEVENLEHSYKLVEIAYRGAQRLQEQIIDEQKRVERVMLLSLAEADSDPERENARDIDDDWLKRFFKYVAEVDEDEILKILARGLSDAAIKGRTILSPKALDTLRFFEVESYRAFDFCAAQMCFFESVPDQFLQNRAHVEDRDVDVVLMIELGLLKETRRKQFSVRVDRMVFYFSFDTGINAEFTLYELTYVGRSIAALMDRRWGQLSSLIRKSLNSDMIAKLQADIGLSKQIVTTYSRQLVSQLADIDNIDVKVSEIVAGRQEDIRSFTRKSKKDEFDLIGTEIEKIRKKYSETAMVVFIDQFYDFDKNQLPYLYTIDENS